MNSDVNLAWDVNQTENEGVSLKTKNFLVEGILRTAVSG